MASKIFRKKVEQEIKNLDREQLVQVAWHCAVFALPYLGKDGNFNYWNNKDKQKYIYAILNAIDFVAETSRASIFKTATRAAADAAAAAAADTDDDAAAAAAAVAASAAIVATRVTDRVDAAASAFIDSRAFAYAALDSRAAFDIVDTADAAARVNNLNLETVILQIIKSISGGGQIISTDIYGKIWNNFQKALKDEGCAYWARLYQELFDNNFEMDREALHRRMNVPKEIKEKGAAAVGNYLEELEKGSIRLNEARIIILGDKGVGKTSIARRLEDPDAIMPLKDESTAGVDRITWKLEKENINVRIWDFAGHTVTHAVHQFFLSERCLYILVYDGRTEERNRLEYWFKLMKNYGRGSKAIILVNKQDTHKIKIPINSLNEYFDNNILKLFNFSIKDDKTDLEAFRKYVADFIIENPSWSIDNFPKSYYDVKEKLEERFDLAEKEKKDEYISIDEFNNISKDCNVVNKDELLKNLKNLGVSLWYKDMYSYNTLVLNPEWISEGLYKIINWVNQNNKYNIRLKEFKKVFNEDGTRYPLNKHEFLFNLMKHSEIELAFKTNKEECLIIPHLLNGDRPKILPEFDPWQSLTLRYVTEQSLLPNTISRFIVRHNEEIKKDRNKYIVWRYGVVLEDGNGSLALVREEDRTISVSVKGKDKTNYISTLRETLNNIFDTYKSEKPELQYRIERYGQIPDTNELWLPDRKIKNLYGKKKPYYDDETDQDISMGGVVTTYNINAPNTTIAGHDIDNSTHTTFNFKDCNIGLQGNLNELAQKLTESGYSEDANELKNTAKAFKEIKDCENKEEIKENGIDNRLKRIVDELGDEDSKLHKTVKGIKYGIGIAQDIAKTYNDIAQWVGMPQVPKPFLKK